MGALTSKQRKTETRTRLLDAASELFAEQGYDDTTLETIAQNAGVHVQTLYRHFPCKTELAAELWHRSLTEFAIFFTARETSAIAAWRHWVELSVCQSSNTINALAGRNSPPVSSRIFEYWDHYQQILAEGLAEDMDLDMSRDMRPMLIACMLWGANQKTAMSWTGKRWQEEKVVASILSVVDTVELLFHDLLHPQA